MNISPAWVLFPGTTRSVCVCVLYSLWFWLMSCCVELQSVSGSPKVITGWSLPSDVCSFFRVCTSECFAVKLPMLWLSILNCRHRLVIDAAKESGTPTFRLAAWCQLHRLLSHRDGLVVCNHDGASQQGNVVCKVRDGHVPRGLLVAFTFMSWRCFSKPVSGVNRKGYSRHPYHLVSRQTDWRPVIYHTF